LTQGLLGIDIGTSGCKALLIDADGAVLASRTETYGLSQPRPGWTEQDPQLWIDGARAAVAGVLALRPDVEVGAIGLSGQMHGLTPLDDQHRVLRPAILWNDQRNGAECAEITTRAGGIEGLLRHTNNRMLVGYTGGKVAWMRNHEPELFGRLRHVLNPKDYLRFVLTGELATEVSDASGTGLFDTRRRTWATGLLDLLEIDPALLPPCHESHVVSGRVSRSGSELFGLKAGIPVVGGGGDSVIQTIGSGVIAPGELQTTIGTAGILAAALDEPVSNPDGRLQVFCNVAPDKWHCMGVSLNAGGAVEWLRALLAGFADGAAPTAEHIAALAGRAPVGSRGLLFLPYLNGERCPHPDPGAQGGFIGLTTRQGAPEMARSVMEGVVFALFDICALMEKADIGRTVIKASGGGARSALWRQMQADLFGCEVLTTEGAAEGGAFGAALVAGLGIGVWPSAEEAAKACRPVTREVPDAAAGDAMRSAFDVYRGLYEALSPSFAAIGAARLDR
jgi:xylulokinase